MKKEDLIKSAQGISEVSKEACDAYAKKADLLLSEMNSRMLSRPDIHELVGENNLSMMKDNHANHIRFMTSVFANYDAHVLVDTILWVFRAYRSHGFTTNYWAAQLNEWLDIIAESLSDEHAADITCYYRWMQINIPAFVELSDNKLESGLSMH